MKVTCASSLATYLT